MNFTIKSIEIKKFVDEYINQPGKLKINREYQRGPVWKDKQKKMFIDSFLRGFPVPMLILFKKDNGNYEIIDGQQRIKAVHKFTDNNFRLLNPADPRNNFPLYLQTNPGDWGNKYYRNLSEETKLKFDNYPLIICEVTDAEEVELRDVFIRLQAGMPLNAQEKRDAMPGDFCGLIRELGGVDYQELPHDFFDALIPALTTDRGKRRQLAAQIVSLFIELEKNARFIDIKSGNLDRYYYEYISLDDVEPIIERMKSVLNELYQIFGEQNIRLNNHEAIHLVLFAKECKNLALHEWKEKIHDAFMNFRNQTQQAGNNEEGDYWFQYLILTRNNASSSRTIYERHKFFCNEMLKEMYGRSLDNLGNA